MSVPDREQLIRQIAPAYVEQFNIDVERVGGYVLMAPADGGVGNVRRFLNALDALGFAVVPVTVPAEAAVRPQERPEGSEATHTAERTVTDPTEQTARIEFRQRCTRCGYTSASDDPNDTHCTAEFVLNPPPLTNIPAEKVVCGGEFNDDGPVVGWWDLCAALGLPADTTPDRLAADLAIAARARACEFVNREIADTGEYETIIRRVERPRAVVHYYEDAAAIVEWLLDGDT